MIPWLLARESRQPFFSVCVRKRYLRWLFNAVPYFFFAFSAARHVFPSEISHAKVASGDSNLCMNLC